MKWLSNSKNKRTALIIGGIVLGSQMTNIHAAFSGDPPDDHHPWALRDDNRPQPRIVTPGESRGAAPSDAFVLFDGSDISMDNWIHEKPADKRMLDWINKDGVLECQPGAGYLMTKEEFGDSQIHIEWKAPDEVDGSGQARGNSGIFLMGIEVQVLDNYQNPTYADGTAGAIYGLTPPAVNALHPSDQWQSYDIIFRRPIVKEGRIVDEGSMTVLVNGIVVQAAVPLDGGGGFFSRSTPDKLFPDTTSLSLQDHSNAVQYRNIWIRPLRSRAIDGGLDGRLSKEVTMSKRREIAIEIRQDSQALKGHAKLLRMLESLMYQFDQEAWFQSKHMIQVYVKQLDSLSISEADKEKKNAQNLNQALSFLNKFELIDEVEQLNALQKLMKKKGWLKPR